MTENPDLICFRHCGKSIFTYDSPSICPLCKKALECSLDLHSTPLALPYPFAKARQYPCSIVLRPSHGDFLSFFQNERNLHIGLTSSDGTIFEYDENGLIETSTKDASSDVWDQCIVISQVSAPWYDRWDDVLQGLFNNTAWSKENYREQSNNCFTFILSFLQILQHDEFLQYCHDKISFSEMFIVPKTQNAAKYITIHRKLTSCRYWVDDDEQYSRDGQFENIIDV